MKVEQLHSHSLAEMNQNQIDSVLLSSEWDEIQASGMLYLKCSSESGVAAYFNAFHYKKFGKSFLITPPGFPYCGFQLIGKANQGEVIHALIAFINRKFPRAYLDLGFPPELQAADLFVKQRFKVKEQPTYLLDLTPDADALLKGLSNNRRRNIQKLKSGYSLTVNNRSEEVLKLMQFTLGKSKQLSMAPIYKRMVADKAPDWVVSILVIKDEIPLATSLVILDQEMAYYYAGGINGDVKDGHAGTIGLWNAILQAKKMGAKTFNFCGSTIPSIEKYFIGFGGAKTTYLRVRRGGKWIDMLKKIKSKIKSS